MACLVRLSPLRALRWCGTFYAELFRNTPEYVLLTWVHFLPPLALTLLLRTRINFSPFFSAVVALGLASSGYFTETLRGGIQSIPPGHIEAARSTGMSGVLTFRFMVRRWRVRPSPGGWFRRRPGRITGSSATPPEHGQRRSARHPPAALPDGWLGFPPRHGARSGGRAAHHVGAPC